MHVIEKISHQLQEQFVSTDCTFVQRIKLLADHKRTSIDMQVTFVYDSGEHLRLLTLCFREVQQLEIERDSVRCDLGELLFYDDEDGTPLHIGDELSSGFSIVCNDVDFVDIKEAQQDWIYFVH